MQNQTFDLTYKLYQFESSSDIRFIKALNIYQNNVSHNEKTNTNEISWVVDNRNKFKNSKPYFFGLELNGNIIGYSEIAYIYRTRYITIDYLIIDEKYKTHSSFYSFILLLIDFFNKLKLDFDFIGIEILTKFEGTISTEEISEFEIEGFKVVNSLYIQPCLEFNNYDSQQEAVLMIYQRNKCSSTISKNAYCEIVNSLYFDYYYEWDSNFFNDENNHINYYNQLVENVERIKEHCEDENIILNGYPFKSISSENKIIPYKDNKNKKLWQALFFVVIFAVVALGVILAIKKMNVELSIVIIIFIFVLFAFLWLSYLAFSDKIALQILKKFPILSKLIEQLK